MIGSFFPRDPPQFYQIPYGYSAIDPIKESLIATEFSDFKAVVVSEDRMISDVAAFARGMMFGNPVIEQIKTRGGIDPEAVTEALARAFRRELGPEPCRTRMQVVMFEAGRRD